MADEPQRPNERGQAFEETIGRLLNVLQVTHPTVITVRHQPKIVLHNGEDVFPDFELKCAFPHQTDIRLIECQDRKKDSQEIQRKIRHIKSLSKYNRFLIVYRDPDYLGPSVSGTLAKDGVPTYDVLEFLDFLRRLEVVVARSENLPTGVAEVEAAIDALRGDPFAAGLVGILGRQAEKAFLPNLLREVGSDLLIDQMSSRLKTLASTESGKDEAMVGRVEPPPWRP